MNKINGWLIVENKYDGVSATKKYIAFHPIYEGQFWKDFDSMDELIEFCTVDKFNEWHDGLTED